MNGYEQMREALVKLKQYMRYETCSKSFCIDSLDLDAFKVIDAALTLPRRNCDVGSAKEQNVRFEKYCFEHRTIERCCQDCPIKDEPCCELGWAQLPYEREEEGDGSK